MLENQPEKLRKYGYDILINRFEPLFKEFLINEVLLINYGSKKWTEGIPKGVIIELKESKDIDILQVEIKDFFEEIYLWGLKEISIYSQNYKYLKDFVSEVGKEKFIDVMDELNEIRKKIAHSKTFTQLDLLRLIELIKNCFNTKFNATFMAYIDNEGYKNADNIPTDFLSRYNVQNNLPIEEYDLEGGFVGRRNEILSVKKLLYSNQDRIVSITGAGGVGKTAMALKLSYNLLADENNPYDAIIWFSAKETKLTPQGIISIEPEVKNCEQLLKNIISIIDNKTLEIFEKNKIQYEKYVQYLNNIFSSQRCLLVIDNLETILKDQETINFIKSIPRPSQVLITSRKGLGEIERRYPLPDFDEKNAVELFRLISRERNRVDLLKLNDDAIVSLVKKVRCYPLLIKWSIGRICLGEEVNEAFSEIYSGKTEIAEFIFDDIFNLFDKNAKTCLYSMVVLGDKSFSKHILMHLSALDADQFDDAIRELMIASFVYQEITDDENGNLSTNYAMLSLTRGFIQAKLDEDKQEFNKLQSRYYELSQQVEQLEKSKRVYDQSLFSLGIKSDDEKIAFNYIKTAKNFIKGGDYDKAEENFENAIKVAPNFIYALVEYAKFEYSRDHVHESNKLFEKAIKVNPENYHSFFTYGICLKKQNKIDDAIKILEQAIELNPEHLPIYNELGRVYTFNGDYDKANEFFEKAKQQQKYFNYRHMFITLHYQADNYRRWSEQFFQRKDIETGMLKLYQARDLIQTAIESRKGDKTLYLLEKDISLNIAINLCNIGKFKEALPYFEKCFEKIKLINGIILSTDYKMAEAYYFLANYSFKLNELSLDKIMNYINKGLAITRDDNFTQKLLLLRKNVESKIKNKSINLRYGIIDYFNTYKHFGIISSENSTYLFFLNSFKKRLINEEINDLKNKTISFTLTKDQNNKDIATSISILY